MITPRFEINQDENTVTISVRAPMCSLNELDVQVEEDLFLFYCKPYHLRLNLPGKIENNDNTHSKFDSDTGVFTFTYDKTNPGEVFEKLDFITKFLCPKVEVKENDRILEVVSSEQNEFPKDLVETEYQYGFAQRGGYNFNYVNTEFTGLFEINPYEVPLPERYDIRRNTECSMFNFDHYLADYIECEEIDEIIAQSMPLKEDKFTSDELDYLKDLPNIIYELSEQQITYAFTSLIDIIYAYCYDQRTTWFEGTCESGWTIMKLSSSLACFDAFATPRDALVNSFRRAVTYPLYRNFKLCIKVLDDLRTIINQGAKQIIKILIELHQIFLKGDSSRYILNHLFIRDYIIYIQQWDDAKWLAVVNEVKSIQIEKEELQLNLDQIEKMTEISSESDSSDSNEDEEDDNDKVLTKQLLNLSLKPSVSLDSDDDTESSGTEESSSEENCSA